jgi:hypothetical protein
MVAKKDKVDAPKLTEELICSIEVCIPSCCREGYIRQITKEITMRGIARDIPTGIIAGLMCNGLSSTVSLKVLN